MDLFAPDLPFVKGAASGPGAEEAGDDPISWNPRVPEQHLIPAEALFSKYSGAGAGTETKPTAELSREIQSTIDTLQNRAAIQDFLKGFRQLTQKRQVIFREN